MERTFCSRRTLAAGDFALVERCSCGAIHVTIGAVTLRIAASAVAPLAETLSDAASALVIEQARTMSPSPELLS
jgi:hypothetical protein